MKPMNSSTPKIYTRPAVVVELDLEVNAGTSPLGDPRRGKPSGNQQSEPPSGE